jgi:spore coat polysaccharide biosynthesis protein SpsF
MILAVLQVRMTSPRLPGKALAPLRGEPLVWRQIERLRMARTVSRILVATSDAQSDDALASFLVGRGQAVFRGAGEDLTLRFLRCVEAAGEPTHVVRVKGDSPFVDPAVVDAAVRLAISSGAAYAGNRAQRSYPRGLEVEVATLDALRRSAAEADPATLAEISPMARLRGHPDLYPQAHLTARRDAGHLDWRVKTPADLAFARGVYDALHAADPGFGHEDILALIQGRQDLARWAA